MTFVLDASVALRWHFDDEGDAAEQLAQRAFEEGVAVPPHWFTEVANGLLRGERRRRAGSAATALFIEQLEQIPVTVDTLDRDRVLGILLPLARAHRLSVYGAAYLELAQRDGMPLATMDDALAEAARHVGIEVLDGGEG